jgi:hypothetical protein
VTLEQPIERLGKGFIFSKEDKYLDIGYFDKDKYSDIRCLFVGSSTFMYKG